MNLAELRTYSESLRDRGSPYAACNHHTMLGLIDELSAARLVIESARRINDILKIAPSADYRPDNAELDKDLAEYDRVRGES